MDISLVAGSILDARLRSILLQRLEYEPRLLTSGDRCRLDPTTNDDVISVEQLQLHEERPAVLLGLPEHANDEGRWVGTATAFATYTFNTDTVVLHGEGAYEGLTAYVLMDGSTEPPKIQAAIFAGEMPPVPEAVSEE